MPRPWTLLPREIAALPIDELALEILRDIADKEDQRSAGGWLTTAARAFDLETTNLLAEGWQWLWGHGLIARSPTNQHDPSAFFITRAGREALDIGPRRVRARELLDVELHPLLEGRVRRQFLLGEFGVAAFVAMRQVEILLREITNAPARVFGVGLVTLAFGEHGAIVTGELPEAERRARQSLFAGALGFFKNPGSHREVEFDDPTEAAEVVLFADLLLRIVDRAKEESEANAREHNRGDA